MCRFPEVAVAMDLLHWQHCPIAQNLVQTLCCSCRCIPAAAATVFAGNNTICFCRIHQQSQCFTAFTASDQHIILRCSYMYKLHLQHACLLRDNMQFTLSSTSLLFIPSHFSYPYKNWVFSNSIFSVNVWDDNWSDRPLLFFFTLLCYQPCWFHLAFFDAEADFELNDMITFITVNDMVF